MSADPTTTAAFLRHECEPGRGLILTSPIAGEGPWSTHAIMVDDDLITVVAPRDAIGPIVRHPGSLLVLQIPTGQALYRVPCTLLDKTRLADPLWTLGDFGAVERIQRRAAYRYRGAFGVQLLPPARKPELLHHFTLPPNRPRNLSATGCYLQATTPLPLSSQVSAVLHLDSEPPLSIEAEVVRHDAPEDGIIGHGLSFVGIDRASQRAIGRFIARQEHRWL
ncbi:MAG TPA: PilZ domain-containing protein [bacterium]|nr:PilZ domain-containing protein [bacterium]